MPGPFAFSSINLDHSMSHDAGPRRGHFAVATTVVRPGPLSMEIPRSLLLLLQQHSSVCFLSSPTALPLSPHTHTHSLLFPDQTDVIDLHTHRQQPLSPPQRAGLSFSPMERNTHTLTTNQIFRHVVWFPFQNEKSSFLDILA